MPKRKHYSPEYKQEVVELVQLSKTSCRQVALDIGINPSLLARWVREAAAGGSSGAMERAQILRENKSSQGAEEGCLVGDAAAIYFQGVRYELGLQECPNDQLAMEFYKKAAKLGHLESWKRLQILRRFHENPSLRAEDSPQKSGAPPLTQTMAPQEEEEAGIIETPNNALDMYCEGMRFEHGIGRPRDDKQAEIWYQKAAQLGHPEAMDRAQALRDYKNRQDAKQPLTQTTAHQEKEAETSRGITILEALLAPFVISVPVVLLGLIAEANKRNFFGKALGFLILAAVIALFLQPFFSRSGGGGGDSGGAGTSDWDA